MLNPLRRLFYSFIRFPRSCGFGVQSPFAYRFVTEVVRDQNCYDYYATLDTHLLNHDLRLRKFYLRLFDFVSSGDFGDVWVIEHIHSSRDSFQLWNTIITSGKVVVSFDVYDCGVIFLRGKMPKINYKIMLV